MTLLRSLPAKISIIISALLLLLSFTSFGRQPMDIQLHDAYFVTDYAFGCRLFAVFYFVLGLLYEICYSWLTPNKGSAIYYGHLLISTFCFGLFSAGMHAMAGMSRRYYTFSTFETFGKAITIVVLILFLSNLAFGLYYVYYLTKKFIIIIKESQKFT